MDALMNQDFLPGFSEPIPRKGTETLYHRHLLLRGVRGGFSEPIPRKGTETLTFKTANCPVFPHRNSFSEPIPRKGTETTSIILDAVR